MISFNLKDRMQDFGVKWIIEVIFYELLLQVSKIFVSDAFNYEQYEGDIAIIQLNKPAKFSSVVLPVCLPENLDDAHLFISSGKHGEVYI